MLVTSLCRRYIGSVVCADVCKSVKVLPYLCAYVQADDVVGVGRRVASRRDHVIAQLGVGNILSWEKIGSGTFKVFMTAARTGRCFIMHVSS